MGQSLTSLNRRRDDIKQRVRDLSHEDRAAFERQLLRRRREKALSNPQRIEPRGESGPCSLSFAQQRLWFLDKLEPDSSLYNIPWVVRLRGALNVEALEWAVNALVERHEILRTVCADSKGQAIQIVRPELRLGLTILDSEETELQQRIRELTGRPFSLHDGPLLRVGLLRLGAQDHVLVMVIHHIIADGWSMGVLSGDLAALYQGRVRKGSPPLPDLPIQYADYAVWQRRWLQGAELERQADYWKRQLAGVPVLELPTDHPRPAAQTYRGRTHGFVLERALLEGLKGLSGAQGVTLFMTLLAAFQTLLSRYSGQEDIVVGSPIAGRTRRELEGLIGFFVNSLALRTDLSNNPTFVELLRRVREVALGAYAHQDLPFEKLVEELQPERDSSRNPLFQVMFTLQNALGSELEFEGVTAERLPSTSQTAKFDLTLTLMEREEALHGAVNYASDLFEPETMERLVGHYRTLLEGIVETPERHLADLPVLTELERQRVLVDWNDTATAYPRDQGIVELFEHQVALDPKAIAVEAGGDRWSYGELNERANRLAHYLRGQGVRAGARVGLCVERSFEMVIGMLAILKAGGGYVPLDPSYPSERLVFMMRDGGIDMVVAQRATASIVEHVSVNKVLVDVDWPLIATQPEGNLLDAAGPEDLAYVIYTSGSTGLPKGVAVPHRGVVRLVVNTDYVRLETTDRVAQISNASFDAATFEVWGALLNGGRLTIFPPEAVLSPPRFASEIRTRGITTLFITTALFNVIARERPRAFEGVKQVLFGGETVDPRWVREVLNAAPPQRLLHVYGPTESTTFATWHVVEDVPDDARTIPIGRPVANTRAYVLDRQLRPVPTGIAGELYLGGDGIAQGYLNRKKLTCERFIKDPWDPAGGDLMYRTGDLVRMRTTGDLEFLGRMDHQVKLRGFRIELGEIEAILQQHRDVTDAVVVLRGGDEGDRRVVAYVVSREDSAPTAQAIGGFLKERLPGYMLPSAVVLLERLPFTPNGKVDRDALPEPESSPVPESACPLEWPPQNAIEVVLQRIWEDLLGVPRVGPQDNFFELGGHSIAAIQMLADVEREFGVQVSVAQLFEEPTVRQLANVVFQGEPWSQESDLVPIQTKGSRSPLYCVYGDAFFLSRELGSDQPLYWFTPWPKRLALRKAAREIGFLSIEDTAREYVDEILKVQPQGPYHLAGHCAGAVIVYEMAQQLRRSGREVRLLALMDPPGSSIRQPTARRVGDAVRDLFATQGMGTRLRYLLRRGVNAIEGRLKMRIAMRRWAVQRHLRSAKPMPIGLTRVYTNELIAEAMKRYRYQSYEGRVVLFRSQAFAPEGEDPGHVPEKWRALVQGELYAYVVAGTGHNDLFSEPHVAFVVNKLRRHSAG